MLWEDNYLAHYGVKGQKWGIRRFQNEDGSYTNEGMQRLAEYRQNMANRFSQARAKVASIRKSSNRTAALTQRSTPKQIDEQKKARTKKIIAAAGAVTLAAAAGYALHKRNKVNKNLIQLAKNKVHESYKDAIDKASGDKLYKLQGQRTKEMLKIDSRRSARKALGMSKKTTKAFIKDNKVGKMKLADIVQKRVDGPLVEGYRRNAAGKMVKLSGRKLEKARKRVAERLIV